QHKWIDHYRFPKRRSFSVGGYLVHHDVSINIKFEVGKILYDGWIILSPSIKVFRSRFNWIIRDIESRNIQVSSVRITSVTTLPDNSPRCEGNSGYYIWRYAAICNMPIADMN